jgi:dTDP-glucose pyrophosphorylase
MENWRNVVLFPHITIHETIARIDADALQIALIVDPEGRLLGTVTDGDVRRAILRGLALTEPISLVMNVNPTTARDNVDRSQILSIMKRKQLRHMPLVDANNILVGLETLDDFIQRGFRENRVVLMAGGLGSRLGALTDACPKPMLKVGDKPLLETILENFIGSGFHRFYISVNYMGDVIRDYFGDGTNWGIDIRYLQENNKLGTAGSLSLLPEKPPEPLLVMNGDLLTNVNWGQLLDFHSSHHAKATMCVREYDLQVPFGVVNVDGNRMTGIQEKPVMQFFINAGIYVLEPDALDLVPADTYFDMPTLFAKLILQKQETVAFPIREYWLDIGHQSDYYRANGEFNQAFT